MAQAGPILVIHGGAGALSADLREREAPVRTALTDAIDAGRRVLESDGEALAAVEAAVTVLEDCELFNAGVGSTLCSDGTVQLSAALMRGSDRAAGAVAALRRTRNPIRAAGMVLASDQVMLVGEEADGAAAYLGAEQVPNRWFVTERQRERWQRRDGDLDRGTVGAVCLDAHGVLAAGTSTGGVRGQPPARVGDTPVIGAGTWADRGVAISCTGDGEAFVRAGVARQIALLVEHGLALPEAADRALGEVVALLAQGGLIAVGANGTVAMPFVSDAMPRAVWRADGGLETAIA